VKTAAETAQPLPLLLKIPEAARELRVDPDTVYEYIRDGVLEAVDIARDGARQTKLRIPSAALVEYIAARPRVHTSTP
jgi:excisionase family DNA binding protein